MVELREKPNSGLNTVYSNVEKYHESDNHLRLRSDKPKGVKRKTPKNEPPLKTKQKKMYLDFKKKSFGLQKKPNSSSSRVLKQN